MKVLMRLLLSVRSWYLLNTLLSMCHAHEYPSCGAACWHMTFCLVDMAFARLRGNAGGRCSSAAVSPFPPLPSCGNPLLEAPRCSNNLSDLYVSVGSSYNGRTLFIARSMANRVALDGRRARKASQRPCCVPRSARRSIQ